MEIIHKFQDRIIKKKKKKIQNNKDSILFNETCLYIYIYIYIYIYMCVCVCVCVLVCVCVINDMLELAINWRSQSDKLEEKL